MLGPQVESTAVVSFLEEVGPRMRKLWLTYSSQTTAILGALLVGWLQAGAEGVLSQRLPGTETMSTLPPAGWLLPPAAGLGGELRHQPQQHSPPAACGGPAERLSPATGICRPTSPACHALPTCSLGLASRCCGC